jgi:hypothetical protein
MAWVVDCLPVAPAGGIRLSDRMSSTRHRRQAVERDRQRGPDARRLVFRWFYTITVLCFENFVNATISKAVEYWTEELDRLGDKIFFGIPK